MVVALTAEDMLSFLGTTQDPIRWDLTNVEPRSFRLAVRHSQGVIVEYFTTASVALARLQELEQLLAQASGFKKWHR